MIRHRQTNYQGFTIIELLLAMSFVSVMLLGIAITVMQIGSIYNKGLTMKSVDQAGRTLSDDMRRTLSGSEPFVIDDGSYRTQRHPETDAGEPSDGGRLCTGTYSYIWNTGRALASGHVVNEYDDSRSQKEIRFVRIRDGGGSYCADPAKKIVAVEATEILAEGDSNLAVQTLSIKKLTSNASIGQALYRVQVELGTNNQDALDTVSMTCKPPSEAASLLEFCSINRFDFTAQAGNRGGQS